jgi:alpha-L-rhamnosidase
MGEEYVDAMSPKPPAVGRTDLRADLSPTTLDHVSASIDTMRGTVSSQWGRRPDGRIDLAVTIPYNTEAEIWVPTQDKPVTAPRDVAFVRDDTSGGAAYKVYRARAGPYRFNASGGGQRV